ncbi:tRNA wybutosine-synthesizing protein 3 homolog isoform X2 [Argiope bruennichi]|uniref:tRNA wybutosine-synthesizing protein 3 homolog isoform X2 n=1 Tax=Argiope bruennichi TaxID=94029 RepID=UPI002495A0E0|nr:tRNA wybutosine-synthesizing protein 3 homolog isoform X2 [Argiope bruennichi]
MKIMNFINTKEVILKREDLSRKGSVDDKIFDLVCFINAQEFYVTTSSCSGRTSVFVHSEQRKKGCDWLLISHDIVRPDDVIQALENHSGSATLKFEPFVLHVQCSTVEAAQKLHTASIESGFRNSGMSVSKKGKIISAIRSTLCLEVPLSCDGHALVSNEYISYVVNMCNEKMKENWLRIERFFSELQNIFTHSKQTAKVKLKNKKQLNPKDENKSYDKINCHDEDPASSDTFFDGFNHLLNNSSLI